MNMISMREEEEDEEEENLKILKIKSRFTILHSREDNTVKGCYHGDLLKATHKVIVHIKERNEYVLVNARCINYEIGCEVLRWTDGCCLKDCYRWIVSSKCPCYLHLWGILIENSCYWIGYNDKYDNTKIDAIVSFDLGKEEFSTVVLPEGRFDPAGVRFLVELKGLLCLVDSPEDVSSMDIWVLKDSKNHIWTKEYIIDLSMFDFGFDFITPLDCKEGKILMDVKFESLEWYDVEKKCFKKIDNLTSRRLRWSVLTLMACFPWEVD
ncbi:hypothetical protein H5410_035636, partial [Solanum commersonii]